MWTWLTNWFSTRDTKLYNSTPPIPTPVVEEQSDDLFKPSERRIYRYWDGKEVLSKDPMELWKRLMDVAPELNVDIKLSRSPSKDAMKGYQGAVNKTRKVFEVKTYEEQGLTDVECMLLLDHFLNYMGAVKKNSEISPTSPMETSSPSQPLTTEETKESPVTSVSSDSGSTVEDTSSEKPTP